MEIPLNMINDAKRLSIDKNITMLVFNSGGNFYVESWYHMFEMPSRKSYYDTITDSTDRITRINKVVVFLESIGFYKSGGPQVLGGEFQGSILDVDYNIENSFTSVFIPEVVIRVKNNLMIEISIVKNFERRGYSFFYDPERILQIAIEEAPIEYKRDLKIKNILTK